MFSIELLVGEDLVHHSYDHVHHARILDLLEQARGALLASIGFPNEQLMAQGKVIVVTRIDVSYRREVKAGPITVTCEDPHYTNRTISVTQRILNNAGKLAVEGHVDMMFMDMVARRGREAPEDFLAALVASTPKT